MAGTPIRHGRLVAGAAILLALAAVALLSLAWTPLPPTRMRILAKLRAPLAEGLLGTDAFGRDVASLLMVGLRNSLMVSLAAVALGASAGILLGVVVAARRGVLDDVVMRGCDILFAFPPVLSAMMLGALLGPGTATAIAAIAAFMVPVFARVARGSALQIWQRDYILAARGAGKTAGRITLGHILPNIAGPLLVQATIQLGLAILTEAGLSFLGLGAPPPAPSLGRMLAEAQSYLGQAPWLAIAPGCAIGIAVLGLNLLGDGLADHVDRRRRLVR